MKEQKWTRAVSKISGDAVQFMAGNLLSKAIGFVFTLVVTNHIGAGGYGLYSYAISLIGIVVLFAPAGADKSVLRFLPEFSDQRRRANGIVGLSLLTAAVGGLLFGGALFLAAPYIAENTLDSAEFVVVLWIIAALVPIRALTITVENTFRGLKLIRPQIVVQQIGVPVLQLGGVLAAFYLGYAVRGVVAGVVVGTFLALILGLWLLWSQTSVRPSLALQRSELKSYYDFSLPMGVRNAGSALYSKADVLVLGWFASPAVVGAYSVAVLVTTIVSLPLSGFNQIFPSFASELYHADEIDQLRSIHSTLIRWTVTISLFAILFLAIYRIEMLRLFGPEFVIAGVSLVLLLIGQMMDAIAYGSGYFLSVSDHQYPMVANQWVFGVLNLGLNIIAIPALGMVGAALATATSISLQNAARIVEAWYLEGYVPYETSILWQTTPVWGGAAVMAAIQGLLDGVGALVVGGTLGFIASAAGLALLATAEDKAIFGQIIRGRTGD